MDNLRFNRKETLRNHYYYTSLGERSTEKTIVIKGYIKCKLMHGEVGTNVVPDLIVYEEDDNKNFKWIQPLAFYPVMNFYYDEVEGDIEILKAQGQLHIDISCNKSVGIVFRSDDYIRSYEDNSELYSCEIYSSVRLTEYYTGTGYFEENHIPFLKLYHHTNQVALEKIQDSGYLKLSNWNIAGTKSLRNIGYLYLTPLEELKYDMDLKQIAMSNEGNILLKTNIGEVRKINIYRRSTKDFGARLELFVDSRSISPSHLFMLKDTSGAVYYQICSPFVMRLGAEVNSVYSIENNIIHFGDNTKVADYIVIGDCDSLMFIAAPYDEENTISVFKVEEIPKGKNLFDFWWEHRNTDQYTDKEITLMEFLK